MNEVEIQILEPESTQTGLECRFDTLGPMIRVPQLCCDEDVFACDRCRGKACLQRIAYFALVPVSFRTIEVPKSGIQSIPGRSDRHGWVRDQSAEAECGYLVSSVLERHSRQPKIRGLSHGTPRFILRSASPPKFENLSSWPWKSATANPARVSKKPTALSPQAPWPPRRLRQRCPIVSIGRPNGRAATGNSKIAAG